MRAPVSRFALCLLLAVLPLAAKATLTVSFFAPTTGASVDDAVAIAAQVTSTYEIASATASSGAASTTLVPGYYCSPGSCYPQTAPAARTGTLNLAGFPRAVVTITVTVTDVLGNTASATTQVFHDSRPVVQVNSPTRSLSRGTLKLDIRCFDDDPAGCTSLQAMLTMSPWETSGDILATGRDTIDTTVDVSAYNGTTRYLHLIGTDSASRTTSVVVGVVVETSPALRDVVTVTGEILDVDATRILHRDSDPGSLAIRDRASGIETRIYANAAAPPGTPMLTSAGAAFTVPTAAFPYNLLKSYEGGALVDLGGINGGTSARAKGSFLIWNNGNTLLRRNVDTHSNVTVSTNAGNTNNDVAANGAVAFWDTTYNIGFFNGTATTFLTSDTSVWNIYPRTDGSGVVYEKETPCCNGQQGGTYLTRAGVTQELVPLSFYTAPSSDTYRIANGWTAYVKPGPSGVQQVWRTDAGGISQQLTFFSGSSGLEAMGSAGSISLVSPAGRYLVPAGATTLMPAGSGVGKPMFAGDKMYVAIINSLLEVLGPGLLPTPGTLLFPGQVTGTTSATLTVTFTNNGSAASNVTSATTAAPFAVVSNTCASVAPGASCTVGVTFSPSANGTATGTLTLIVDGASQDVPLAGSGVQPQAIQFGAAPTVYVNADGFVNATGGGSGNAIVFSSLTPAVCSVSATGLVSGVSAGTCTIAADQPGDLQYQAAPQVTLSFPVTVSAAIGTRMASLSTRMQILTGDNVLIGGFGIDDGPTPKRVVIRARGPSLASQGVANVLANPTLTVVPAAGGATITNDNWQDDPGAAEMTRLGLAPSSPFESATLATLQPGLYTAIVSGVGGTTGVGIVEVIEADTPEQPLVAISTRGSVGTGDNVLIGGLIVRGSTPQTVVVRARGPSLPVAGALANPTLTLVPASGSPLTNDDWGTAPNAAQISTSGFAPSDPRESAMLVTLNPGAYTAIVSGAGGTTGIAIVEVFAVP